jgi:hypothetical protein
MHLFAPPAPARGRDWLRRSTRCRHARGAAEIADEGAVARRAISMRGQQAGWVHHRSLCERLARALGVPLRFANFDDAATPYGMG